MEELISIRQAREKYETDPRNVDKDSIPKIWVIEGYNLSADAIKKIDAGHWDLSKNHNERITSKDPEKMKEADGMFVRTNFWYPADRRMFPFVWLKIEDYNRTWGFDAKELILNRARLMHSDNPLKYWGQFLRSSSIDGETDDEYNQRMEELKRWEDGGYEYSRDGYEMDGGPF